MSRRGLPPLRALTAFEAAARLGSFRLAAEELGITRSAISHQIKALEDVLGLTLFSGTLPIGRSEIEFALPAAGHPLHDLLEQCVGPSAPRPARRCLFVLDEAPLGVHEVFLPALEGSLAAAPIARTA